MDGTGGIECGCDRRGCGFSVPYRRSGAGSPLDDGGRDGMELSVSSRAKTVVAKICDSQSDLCSAVWVAGPTRAVLQTVRMKDRGEVLGLFGCGITTYRDWGRLFRIETSG